MAGVLVPLLPATPFLLLTAYLFGRSSERLYGLLFANRLIGDYLKRYYERRCVSRRHKAATLALLWIALASTAPLSTDSWWVGGILGSVDLAVKAYILMLPAEKKTTGWPQEAAKPLPRLHARRTGW